MASSPGPTCIPVTIPERVLVLLRERHGVVQKFSSRMRFLQVLAPLTSSYTTARSAMSTKKLHVDSLFVAHAVLPSLVRVFGDRQNTSDSSSSSAV